MRIADWARAIARYPAFDRATAPHEQPRALTSIPREARPFVVAAAWHRTPRKTLIVTGAYDAALGWQARLTLAGVPSHAIHQLPSGLSSLFEDAAPETIALSDRIGALKFLIADEPGFVIATAGSALERTLPREVLQRAFLQLNTGMSFDLDEIRHTLAMLGYEAAEPVRSPGQFSRRGGILDVFAMGHENPIRLEFFGDEIESLREFDPNTQRSICTVDVLELVPSRESLILPETEPMGHFLLQSLEMEAVRLDPEAAERLTLHVTADAESLDRRTYFDRIDLYRPLLHPESGCAVDLLGENGRLVIDDPADTEARAAKAEEELTQALEGRAARGEMLHAYAGDFLRPVELLGRHEPRLSLVGARGLPEFLQGDPEAEFGGQTLTRLRNETRLLGQALSDWRQEGYTIVIGSDQPNRVRAMLGQVDQFPVEELAPGPGLYLAHGNLAGGFELPTAKFALLTDREIFGVGRLRLPQRRFNEGVPVATVLDLQPGDFVVHINFGIGVYQGLVKREIAGVKKEFLYIEYQPPDKLYVPADQLDRIQKYLSPGEGQPKVNRLSGGEWQRTVGKAREEAREFARGLTRLYAERKRATRPAYGEDSPWQAEMEATFPWVETAAQADAIRDVKSDLDSPFPMDRLICGDVGFGKTEVAIRAAFKVATAGRQIALLCPTTILSEQHYRSFAERLGPFSVRLRLLNRFCTSAHRKEVLREVENGEMDILIGTHALLNAEVKFKDLGLVVIDEEQKFGVKQKEALKHFRAQVDVLSLSATPIPRTLSMALMDLRQMSLINDPPPGRLPIRTVVRSYSKEVVREAILRELQRGGQVYYVYNRVQGISHALEQLQSLVPSARIAVGHGQMNEKELEPVMMAFIQGEVDILLSTTIVESGLDISNANTLIVENADRFGLSQLYQLRGRVGRSDRQAYAYLLYHSSKSLTENASARLEALQEFSSLGSGYSLAFRDLQIRGAGDLLGAKQSGTMATVGYELFTQLIEEEVAFLKSYTDGEAPRDYKDPLEGLKPLPGVDLPIVALIPDGYIEEQAQRLYFYRELMSARTPQRLGEVRAEMSDRYGHTPEEVERAFAVMSCRIRAHAIGIEKIDGHGGRLAATLDSDADINPRVISLLGRRNRETYLARGQLIWPFTGDPLTACETFLHSLESCIRQVEEEREAFA